MAVGIIFLGVLTNNPSLTMSAAYALSIGIAIQSFPEGAIISIPLKTQGYSKVKAFLYGIISGIVEPIAAVIAIIFGSISESILPIFLSFAAGAMFYVTINELIPNSQGEKNNYSGTIGFSIGFLIMMILDVLLG